MQERGYLSISKLCDRATMTDYFVQNEVQEDIC